MTMREFWDNVRKMGSLSGLRFVSERCTDQEFAIVTQDMYVRKDEHYDDDTTVSMLCKFNLFVAENNKENKK